MLNNTSLLVLRLEGVLQSWGEDAKWDTRGSASFPQNPGLWDFLPVLWDWSGEIRGLQI